VVTFTIRFFITWPKNKHPQKFLANELPITSELGKKKNLSDMALLQRSCTMNAVEIKKQKNTPKVEEKQQDILG
jgi:hypothetical protein